MNLVEELRRRADSLNIVAYPNTVDVLYSAADEIECLRRERDRLATQLRAENEQTASVRKILNAGVQPYEKVTDAARRVVDAYGAASRERDHLFVSASSYRRQAIDWRDSHAAVCAERDAACERLEQARRELDAARELDPYVLASQRDEEVQRLTARLNADLAEAESAIEKYRSELSDAKSSILRTRSYVHSILAELGDR